jgi:outer membrane receptor protein involved in Fe transport
MSASRKFIIEALALFILILPGALAAGTSGMVSGFVRDKETGMGLPGAAVFVENTTFGATADKYGFYIIYNLPVGNYNLRAKMIGYLPMKVTDVEVKTDINTPVGFALAAQALKAEQEIVVTAPRIKIYKDVSASVHFFDEKELSVALPVQNFQEALALAPGFVANRFRGGRSANTLYLIDGMPASGPVTRDLAFMVPNSAIAEMVVQTGGFNAEYGNVSGGLVNIISKEGRNDFQGMAKVSTDVLSRSENGFENSHQAEFALSGPLTLGLGGPVIDANYLISGGLNLSDTPKREALREAFTFPIVFNYDLNTKLAIHASKNLYIRWQTLLTDYDWRRYDADWAARLSALPRRKNRSLRTSLSLTHTLNPRTFYKLDLVGMDLQRQVLGEIPDTAPANVPVESQSVAAAWLGATEPWQEQSRERQISAHLSFIRQLNQVHQLKVGLETNVWNLSVNRVRYLLWPNQPKDQTRFVYSRYVDTFHEYPFTLAGYLSHKIELSNFLLEMGVRYELFSPHTRRQPGQPAVDNGDTLAANSASSYVRSKQTIAPRLNIAIPVSPIEHLSFNFGWFYELPQLHYLYLTRDGNAEARWPLAGNVDLKPHRAEAWEITYRRVPAPQSVYSITGFYRIYDDLVDAFPYVERSVSAADTVLRYENRAQTSTTGFEVAFKRDFGHGINGGFYYTHQRSIGTASWPESNLLALARHENIINQSRAPLAWDQRHTFTFNLNFVSRKGLLIDAFGKLNGPATAADWLTGERTHLPWRHDVDLKLVMPMRWDKLRFEPFVEIHNLFDERYDTPGEGGLDFSEPLSNFSSQIGRQILMGIMLR